MDNLEARRRVARNDHEYFSNRGQSSRELDIVRFLLRCVMSDKEIPQMESLDNGDESKADVFCDEVSQYFQVKEIVELNFKRNDFYRKQRRVADSAEVLTESYTASEPYSIASETEQALHVKKILVDIEKKYDGLKHNLNLVFYATSRYMPFHEIYAWDDLKNWRSVSCVCGNGHAKIFNATEGAMPAFQNWFNSGFLVHDYSHGPDYPV